MLDTNTLGHLPMDVLRTFAAAAELGSFTAAGREVHRTQSAVSMQVKRLEEDLGRTLFTRGPRAVALTPDGETLLGYARRLLRLHDEAMAALTAPRVSGVVRLGVPDDYATRHLPEVLARFARAHPDVRVDVRCDDSRVLSEAVHAGELDLCLATAEARGADAAPTEGAAVHLARQPLVWAGAADLDLTAIWRPGPADAAPLPLAVFHEGCLHRRLALAALDAAHIPWRIAFGSLSLAAIIAAVRTGFAVSPLTRDSLAHGCRALPEDSGLPPLPEVGVVLHRGAGAERPAAALLARFVEERFAASAA